MILEKSVGLQQSMPALDAPGKSKNLLITNKVATQFFASLCTSTSYMSFLRATDSSRMMIENMTKATSHAITLSIFLGIIALLQACSSAPLDTRYRQSELHPVLKVPAGLDQPLSNPRLMIPKGANIDESGRVAGIDDLDADFELPPQLKPELMSEIESGSVDDFVKVQRSEPAPVRSKSHKH